MYKLPPPVALQDVRAAIFQSRVVSVHWRGRQRDVHPHLLVQAPRSGAFVVVSWEPAGEGECGRWIFPRFAELRGLEFRDRSFMRRTDTPHAVPGSRRSREDAPA